MLMDTLDPVDEMHITVSQVGTVVRDCVPYLTGKLTVHKEMVNIFNIIMVESAISVNIQTESCEIT